MVSSTSEMNVFLALSKSSGAMPVLVEPLLFVKFILFKRDFAHDTDKVAGPPFLDSLLGSITWARPFAVAIVTRILTGHPISLNFKM